MRNRHFKFFIIYAIIGFIGMLVYISGMQSNLIFIGSLFLIMAAVVHFKHWKDEQIEEYKRK